MVAATEEKPVCLPCRRRFSNASKLKQHQRKSEVHNRQVDKREDKMRRRKKELIMAARAVKQQIFEAEEALQAQAGVASAVQEAMLNQKGVLELQLQQLLNEYGMAQEMIETSMKLKEAKEAGVEPLEQTREMRVGELAITAGVSTWQSNKDVQEDRYMLDIEVQSPEGLKIAGFAVLDGHSGSRCVEHVVEHFPGFLKECIGSLPRLSDEGLSRAVHEACAKTDQEFLAKARETEILDGSTMILALIYPQDHLPGCKLLVACIGDSRAVLCKACPGDGPYGSQPEQFMAVPLSEDHKPNREDERRRVENKGGVVDFEGVWRVFMPGPAKFGGQLIARWGLAVSRSFGDLLLKEAEKYDCVGVAPGGLVISQPEIRIMELQPDVDRFAVLASDGVWDVVSNEDAVAICAAQPTAELAAQRLLRHTYASNTDDNITALVVTWRVVE